ncbi:MAG: hypothetical protein COB84_10250 [Rhodobacteraceae bacterium]|nr:MAG: hypothetical protein COB84_10250 [Paracoccaceae bacterium]
MYRFKLILISFIVFIVFTSVSNGSVLSKYSVMSDKDIIYEIFTKSIIPQAIYIYQDDADDLAYDGVDWRDVAKFYSSCVLREVSANATRLDLEIIHFVWVANRGRESRASKKVIKSIGSTQYTGAGDVVGGAEFDCVLEAIKYVDKMKT